MLITLNRISKSFGSTAVLRDVSFRIEANQLFFLLGPSGCGKTTLLRLLAGFSQPDHGEIRFGERLMNRVPANERNTGMVFQNYALWPHLTVAQNVAYGLEVRGLSREETQRRVGEALEIVQMGGYAQRSPGQLSGGQQQRVALARALVVKPDVLFLDEPLSNLDARLRLEMRDEIRRIHSQTRITTVYVTHDQKEALSLADRIAVLRQGEIAQMGTPEELYTSPVDRFVADFMGDINWLEGTLATGANGQPTVESTIGTWAVAPEVSLPKSRSVWVGIRPEAFRFEKSSINTFEATIRHGYYLGEAREYRLSLSNDQVFKVLERSPAQERAAGSSVSLTVSPCDLLVLAR